MLIKAYGPKSDGWIGKTIELYVGKLEFKGQKQDSVLPARSRRRCRASSSGNRSRKRSRTSRTKCRFEAGKGLAGDRPGGPHQERLAMAKQKAARRRANVRAGWTPTMEQRADLEGRQVKCLIASEGHRWMKRYFDRLPPVIRHRLAESRLTFAPHA